VGMGCVVGEKALGWPVIVAPPFRAVMKAHRAEARCHDPSMAAIGDVATIPRVRRVGEGAAGRVVPRGWEGAGGLSA
jgi:hypothetical protein